jgi:hypothetical protein
MRALIVHRVCLQGRRPGRTLAGMEQPGLGPIALLAVALALGPGLVVGLLTSPAQVGTHGGTRIRTRTAELTSLLIPVAVLVVTLLALTLSVVVPPRSFGMAVVTIILVIALLVLALSVLAPPDATAVMTVILSIGLLGLAFFFLVPWRGPAGF